MNRTERFYRIDQLLQSRRLVTTDDFLEELGVSRATLKRDIEYMRERLNAPIVWDRDAGAYCFDQGTPAGPVYELPGLWFSASELYALLSAHELLSEIAPGLLADHVAPLRARLALLLEASGHAAVDIAHRVRLIPLARRPVQPRFFAEVARALLERRRLDILAWHRGRNEEIQRQVSPQRLVYYRDNWYLDAWCHLRNGLRSFSVDTFRSVTPTLEAALEVSDADLDQHFRAAYGIFSGEVTDWAVLRFDRERARWVESERWHRDQQGEPLPDGGYRLRVPYADPREILMDILRHGAHVVVEEPASLRRLVADEASRIAARYGSARGTD